MPIYAYKCESCGHRQDVLQKISDPVLTVCPACGAAAFAKQVTAAGFQLKGSGWYVTDFRGGASGAGAAAAKKDEGGSSGGGNDGGTPSSGGTAPTSGGDSTPSAAGGCGASCACH